MGQKFSSTRRSNISSTPQRRAPSTEPRAASPSRLEDCRSQLTILLYLAGDELSLIRASETCRSLSTTARNPALWTGSLRSFFDGELPSILDQEADPLETLREQVQFARWLSEQERKLKAFILPSLGTELQHPDDEAGWHRQCDEVVADLKIEAGCKKSKPGRPYYGCSGGAYTSKSRIFGHYAVVTITNTVLAGLAANFTKSEAHRQLAVRKAWHYLDKASIGRVVRKGKLPYRDADYVALSAFTRWKLDELRKRFITQSPPIPFKAPEGSDVNVKDGTRSPPSIAGLLPRLNAGFYGGCFDASDTWTSIGCIYSVDCILDGSQIADYSAM